MGDTSKPATPVGGTQEVYHAYRNHASGLRIHTDSTIQAALLAQYPSHYVACTSCNLVQYAEAGNASATLSEDGHPTLSSWTFEAATRRASDGSPAGTLTQKIVFGRYDYVWQKRKFQVFVVDGQNSPIGQCDRRWYLLSRFSEKEAAEALVLAASIWSEQSHNEVWVYDQGWWSKDKELWRVVQAARWEDVILDEGTKNAIMRDVAGFFDAKSAYAEFGTPWKVCCPAFRFPAVMCADAP
jgi:transitional endoplasmic reticulum ATPase